MALLSKRNTTHLLVSFFTHSLVVGNRIDAYDPFRLPGGPQSSSLVSVTYSKTMTRPSGDVSIVLKARKVAQDILNRRGKLWMDLLSEGDWWLIESFKNGERVVVGFGKIDQLNYAATSVNGAVVATVTISGRDYGFGLEDTPVYVNPYDQAIDNTLGVNMMSIIDQPAGNPGTTVRSIIRGFTGVSLIPVGGTATPPGVSWGYIEVPPGLSTLPKTPWGLRLDTRPASTGGLVQDDLRGAVLLTDLLTPDSGAALWELVRSWSNPCLNEVYIDTAPTLTLAGLPVVRLVVRERPFENILLGPAAQWFQLSTWEVDTRLCTAINLSTGLNRINYIVLTGDMKPVLQDQGLIAYPPVVNLSSIRRYGLRRLEESSIYDYGETLIVPQLPFAASYREWLFNLLAWNALNHKYWQGTITSGELRPEIRVGEKVTLKNAHMANLPGYPQALKLSGLDPSFYVEGVSHQWSGGQSPTGSTTITVSRGYQDDLRVAAIAAELPDWTVQSTIPSGPANSGTGSGVGVTTVIEQFKLAKRPQFEPPGSGKVIS